jgi:hypothetical protein
MLGAKVKSRRTAMRRNRAKNHWLTLTTYVALGFCALTRIEAGSKAVVELSVDLLDVFGSAQVTNASSCELRRPASAGGVKQDALFEHPAATGRPARVSYSLHLPAVEKGQLLLFAFDIGIADGAQLGEPADGVRFEVELEGQKVFAQDCHEGRWQSQAVDLSSFAGRRVRLTLVTDAIKNSSYDWAVWGNPRVLWFHDLSELQTNVVGKVSIPIRAGALALNCGTSKDLRVFLKFEDSASRVEWPVSFSAPTSNHTSWAVKDFKLSHTREVELEWEPHDAPVKFFAASYPPQSRLSLVSVTRSVVSTEDNVPLRIQVKNDGRGQQEEGSSQVQVQVGGHRLPVRTLPALGPGEEWRGDWDWQASSKPGRYPVTARLTTPGHTEERNVLVEVFRRATDIARIQNEAVRLDFVRQPNGFAHANVFARQSNNWTQVAVWRPLFQVVSETQGGVQTREMRPVEARRSSGKGNRTAQSIEFAAKGRDSDGVEWRAKLEVRLDADHPIARLHYEWAAGRPRAILRLLGPNIYVGDGMTGDAKSWGLFPGLEYLFGCERSSNPRDFAPNLADRRTPHPHKITVPLMAVSVGPTSQSPPEKPERFFTPDSLKDLPLPKATSLIPQTSALRSEITVALGWNPLQLWDGTRAFPAARFASPNLDEGMRNHRLGLFLPSTPEFVPENGDAAAQPYTLAAGETLKLDAALVVSSGPVNSALREWLREAGGLPRPNPWPRSFQEELDVCRSGFLSTVWDERNEKWRHVIGGGSSHAPGFATLLWLDARLAESPEARRKSRERVERAIENMLRDGGPASLTSQANCHIMQWELPFYCGFLPEAMAGLENQIKHLIQTQRPDGGWVYQPANEAQADLGQQGDSVLGTCAQHAAALLRFARVTGDTTALEAGEKALRFMERFRVPRGGQTWECPMYEPDILAAAYAVRAYHDGYRSTGNHRWLHDALYWAESGVPFVYLWTLPDKPMMLGATIPVFGSTYYTHSWLAMPVQWCGLVYAFHVEHLAEELQRTSLPETDSPLPLALSFTPHDWKRLVELITVSAMSQQFGTGERIGTYPDSISQFEQRNPVYINPEDILVNVLALKGRDPDIKTSRIKSGRGEIIISSGAEISDSEATSAGARWRLHFFPGEPSHSLIIGLKPQIVYVDGKRLEPSERPVRGISGWWWDETKQHLYLTAWHERETVQIEIVQQ